MLSSEVGKGDQEGFAALVPLPVQIEDRLHHVRLSDSPTREQSVFINWSSRNACLQVNVHVGVVGASSDIFSFFGHCQFNTPVHTPNNIHATLSSVGFQMSYWKRDFPM